MQEFSLLLIFFLIHHDLIYPLHFKIFDPVSFLKINNYDLMNFIKIYLHHEHHYFNHFIF